MFKIIKKTDWVTSAGNTGSTLTLAYKGRVYSADPSNFEAAIITDTTFDPKEKCEAIKDTYVDKTGETRTGLRLVPVSDIGLVDA